MTNRDSARIPYLAIGNNELGGPIGETAPCPHCREVHPVLNSEPPQLQFVKCPINETAYIVGVDGKEWIRD